MHFSVFALLALAVVGAVILGGLVLSVVLLLNEKTRVAGIVLLVIILGIPVVGAGMAMFAWAGMPVSDRAAPIPPPRSVQLEPPVVDVLPAREEPGAVKNGDRSDQAEPPPAAEQIEPEAPEAQPDAGAEAGRLLPHRGHRRLNG